MRARKDRVIDLEAAYNKLRHAELFRDHLQSLPTEIAHHMLRSANGDYRIALEAYFSACLSAAKSCYYVLMQSGRQKFKEIESQWRTGALEQQERARFNAMLDLRDHDVHHGQLGAEVLPKMIAVRHEGRQFYSQSRNAALFGPATLAEHQNPDGTIERAAALQSTAGLYIEICGARVEAVTACTDFIRQLHSLLRAAADAAANSGSDLTPPASPPRPARSR